MKTVFIDGNQGTTGLRIFERLNGYKDISVFTLPDDKRKDIKAKREALNSCDIAFLCLPDEAARESVSLVENKNVTVIDTSTAHRCDKRFAYGFPELSESFEKNIADSTRIAVPGCHASGFIALVKPLIDAGVLARNSLLTCHSITGYSGGGKKMIAQYEAPDNNYLLSSPRIYGLPQQHKHLPEMTVITGLDTSPIFCPVVSDYYSGMLVTVPIFAKQLACTANELKAIYQKKYTHGLVGYTENMSDGGFISSNALSQSDKMEISVLGNDERILLTARYDNLGKGASGAAVECLNIKLGNELSYHLNA